VARYGLVARRKLRDNTNAKLFGGVVCTRPGRNTQRAPRVVSEKPRLCRLCSKRRPWAIVAHTTRGRSRPPANGTGPAQVGEGWGGWCTCWLIIVPFTHCSSILVPSGRVHNHWPCIALLTNSPAAFVPSGSVCIPGPCKDPLTHSASVLPPFSYITTPRPCAWPVELYGPDHVGIVLP
jgi:hypothetical protein